jgi:hypothetical protein
VSTTTVPVYQHSGRWAASSVMACVVLLTALAIPAGFTYSYLVSIVPWDIMAIATALWFGFVVGVYGCSVVKKRRIRNNRVAGWIGVFSGCMALYWAWVAHIYIYFEYPSLTLLPQDIWSNMLYLYEHGTHAHGEDPFNGVPLALCWVFEALIICGLSWIVVLADISDTPFCERHNVWLEESMTIDTLSLFSDQDLELLAEGDLQPLLQARPRHIADPAWTRLLLKYSTESNETYTMRMRAVHLKQNKEGELQEEATDITQDLVLDRTAFEVIKKFADLQLLDDEQGDIDGSPA